MPLWNGVRHTWTGYDGTVWDLSDHDAGIFMTQAGVRGMHMPEQTTYRRSSPALPGSRYRGGRTAARSVLWPLYIFSDEGTDDFIEREGKFFDSVAPGRQGVWSVYSGFHQDRRRDLVVRFDHNGDQQFTLDPTLVGAQGYALQGTADSPYWLGEQRSQSWSKTAGVNYYGGATGRAAPWVIGASSALATASLTNDGDVDAPLTWRADGPFDSVQMGIEGRLLTYIQSHPVGEYVVFRTDNAHQDALLYRGELGKEGVFLRDVTSSVTESDWQGNHLPAKATTPLQLEIIGSGTLTGSFREPYYRAY